VEKVDAADHGAVASHSLPRILSAKMGSAIGTVCSFGGFRFQHDAVVLSGTALAARFLAGKSTARHPVASAIPLNFRFCAP
jgi:hypothetical protein